MQLRKPGLIEIFWWTAFAAALLAAIYAVTISRFVPSDLGIAVAKWAAAFYALGGIRLAFAGCGPGWSWPVLRRVLLRAPLFAVLGYVLAYEGFMAGIPAAYTAIMGSYDEQVIFVSGWRQPTPFSCGGPNIQDAPLVYTICLDDKLAKDAPAGDMLIIHGPMSPFGIFIADIYKR
jgi:hypothetical protein